MDVDDLFPIFLKTGNQPTIEADRIDEIEAYAVFDRRHFLKVLDSNLENDQILLDYRQCLQGLEDRANRFANSTAPSKTRDRLAREGRW